jgi:phospholipid transport system substrate-binding protein
MIRAFACALWLLSAGVLPAHAADAQAADAPAAVPGPSPQVLMEKVSQDLLRELDANRAGYQKDPAKLRGLVDKYLLPNFDTDFAARRVLGKHWTTATPDQRRRFIDAFVNSLMGDYGDAILEFTADRLKILPFRGDPAATSATVRTLVKRDDGTEVPVNYTLRATPAGWKAWDVTIEGISYVKNFQTDFGTEINDKGLEHLIERLEAQQVARTAPGKAAGK